MLVNFAAMTMSDKIRHKMKFDRRELLGLFADKVGIRAYVENLLGSAYLVPVIAIYDSIERMDLTSLSEDFVLKPSHGSQAGFFFSQAMPVLDREVVIEDIWSGYQTFHISELPKMEELVKATAARWLTSVFQPGVEWCYSRIQPRLIIEKRLSEGGLPPANYKFWVFHGKCYFYRVSSILLGGPIGYSYENFAFSRAGDLIDLRFDWEEPNVMEPPKLPADIEEMIQVAEKLSGGIDFVRVDLYNVDGQILFSELTNYPFAGNFKFIPESFESEISSQWKSFDGY